MSSSFNAFTKKHKTRLIFIAVLAMLAFGFWLLENQANKLRHDSVSDFVCKVSHTENGTVKVFDNLNTFQIDFMPLRGEVWIIKDIYKRGSDDNVIKIKAPFDVACQPR